MLGWVLTPSRTASSGTLQHRLAVLAFFNAGPDPRGVATRLPRLDVLLDVSGERDVDLGRDLARAGRGRCRLVRDHTDVAHALSAIFSA